VGLLRSELYRAFHRRWTYIAFAFGLLIAVSGYIGIQVGDLPFSHISHEYNAWYVFLQVFGMNLNSIWGIAVPLFAALPFGDTLIYDLNHGFEVPLMLRVGMKRYFFSKWLANIIVVASVSFAVLSCALSLALLWRQDVVLPAVLPPQLIAGMPLPSGIDPLSGVFASSYQPHVLSGLFWVHPSVYSLLAIVIGVLVSISIGSITMVASLFFKKRYLVLAAPFIFYMVFNVAVQVLGLKLWVPFLMSAGFLNFKDSIWPTIFYWSPLILLSWITMYLGPSRYRKFKLALSNSNDQ
jgi:hypothetical protein